MRKLRQLIYPILFGAIIPLIFLGYTIVALFSVFALLMIMQYLNTYKIAMMLNRFAQNAKKLHFENKLNTKTGCRNYNDDTIDNCKGVRCR
jgi:hypothetical protein